MDDKTIETFKEKAKENLQNDGFVMPLVALENRDDRILRRIELWSGASVR